MPVVVALLALVLGVWTLNAPRRLRTATDDAVGDNGVRAGAQDVSVIIPARDEAHNLPRLLASLAASNQRPAEVIVVDDGSTDGTADVAASFGAVVLTAAPLPGGWVGKNWACHLGAQRAEMPILVFLDADTWLSCDALDALVSTHAAVGGLLSVQPYHRVRRAYERLSAVFNVASLMGSGAFGLRVASRVRVAFGPCLVTSVDDYQRVGGHESVRGEIVEDIALAARYADAALAVTCVLGGPHVGFQMYPAGLRSLVQGWSKNIATGASRAPASRVVPSVLWVMAVAAVETAFVGGVIGWVAGGTRPVAASIAWLAVTAHIATMLRGIGSFGAATAILFIVPLVFFVIVFGRAMVLAVTRRPVQWRGRAVLTSTDRGG